MKLKIYSIAIDGDCGTISGAYATEKEAYELLLNNLQLTEDEQFKARELLAGEDTGELEDLLQEAVEGSLDTWDIEECEVEFPFIDPLLAVAQTVGFHLNGLNATLSATDSHYRRTTLCRELTKTTGAALDAIRQTPKAHETHPLPTQGA